MLREHRLIMTLDDVQAVRRDGGGQRCAIAAVLTVDVLHDLFAALVLEVDVDMVPI